MRFTSNHQRDSGSELSEAVERAIRDYIKNNGLCEVSGPDVNKTLCPSGPREEEGGERSSRVALVPW